MEFVNFKNNAEEGQHQSVIEHLCGEFPEACEIVPFLYEGRLLEFTAEAKVRTYISIFIVRELRETLRSLHKEDS